MSDPAKTPEEIEDVLASIRRLVSDHSPAPDGAMQSVEAEAEEPMLSATSKAEARQTEALVLTPSFRVTDPEDPWVPVVAAQEARVDEDLVAEIVGAESEDAESADAHVETAQNGDDTDWQPDDRLASFDAVGAEADAPAEPETVTETSDDDIEDLIRLEGSSTDFESETGDENWPESGAEAALLTLVARREPAVGEAEAETSESENDLAMSDGDDETDADVAHDVSGEDTRDADATDTAVEGEDDGEDAAADFSVESTAEVDEAAAEDADGQGPAEDEGVSEPQEDEADATPIFARQAVVETEDEGTPEAQSAPVEDLGDTPSPFSFPETEDGILDEDTLREIIVDVVREELQGVLGQRITRNVRKMVRREIRLALAAEDLE